MVDRPLTGIDGARALQALMRLGNAGARFDGRAVDRAVRAAAGRSRVLAGLRRALAPRRPTPTVLRTARARTTRSHRGRVHGHARARSAPARPSDPRRPAAAGGR